MGIPLVLVYSTIAFAIAIFIHELAHALVGLSYGDAPRSINIFLKDNIKGKLPFLSFPLGDFQINFFWPPKDGGVTLFFAPPSPKSIIPLSAAGPIAAMLDAHIKLAVIEVVNLLSQSNPTLKKIIITAIKAPLLAAEGIGSSLDNLLSKVKQSSPGMFYKIKEAIRTILKTRISTLYCLRLIHVYLLISNMEQLAPMKSSDGYDIARELKLSNFTCTFISFLVKFSPALIYIIDQQYGDFIAKLFQNYLLTYISVTSTKTYSLVSKIKSFLIGIKNKITGLVWHRKKPNGLAFNYFFDDPLYKLIEAPNAFNFFSRAA